MYEKETIYAACNTSLLKEGQPSKLNYASFY